MQPSNIKYDMKIQHIKFYYFNINYSIGKYYRTYSIHRLGNNRFPTCVDTIKGSSEIYNKILNFLAIKEVTKDNVAPKSKKHIHQWKRLSTYRSQRWEKSLTHP